MKLAAAYLRATYGADQRAVFKVKRYGGATAPITSAKMRHAESSRWPPASPGKSAPYCAYTRCGYTALFDTFGNHCGFTALSAMPVQHPSAHHQVNAPRQC